NAFLPTGAQLYLVGAGGGEAGTGGGGGIGLATPAGMSEQPPKCPGKLPLSTDGRPDAGLRKAKAKGFFPKPQQGRELGCRNGLGDRGRGRGVSHRRLQ